MHKYSRYKKTYYYMETLTNEMIKSQIADNLSDITLLTAHALSTDDQDYLLFINGLLDTFLKYITSEIEEDI